MTSATRVALLPDIPTMHEAGLQSYAAIGYVGVMVTGGTPSAIIRTLNTAINDVLREEDLSRRFGLGLRDERRIGGGVRTLPRPRHRAICRADDIARGQIGE